MYIPKLTETSLALRKPYRWVIANEKENYILREGIKGKPSAFEEKT